MQLKRRHINVLLTLADDQKRPFTFQELPDGNGICGRAAQITMGELLFNEMIAREPAGYRITAAGMSALIFGGLDAELYC